MGVLQVDRPRSRTSVAMAVGLAAILASCSGTATPVGSRASSADGSGPAPSPALVATPTPGVTIEPMPSPSAAPLTLLGELPTAALDPARAATYQAVLDDLVKSGAPDAIAAVVSKEGVWAGAAGIDGPNGRAAEPTDEFAIASVSKVFVAALLLRLAEQGKLDLDAPLATYLDGIDVDANGATVRQALAMRSGLGDTVDGAISKSLDECGHPLTRAEVLATIPKPDTPAGSDYHYSNPTYKLLHWAAEQASGSSFGAALTTQLLDPVGLDRIILQGPGSSAPRPWAEPIPAKVSSFDMKQFGAGGTMPCIGFSTLSLGASAIAADAPSLAAWGWYLFAGKLIKPQSLAEMTAVDRNGHGLGIDALYDLYPEVAYGHSGSLVGYAAILAVLPERQVAVALFINNDVADTTAALGKLLVAIRR